MHAHIPVVCRTIQAQVDTEGYRAPCWVLCAAVETYLFTTNYQRLTATSIIRIQQKRTLFAGFAFNLVKMFWDWVFVASAMVTASNRNNGVGVGGGEEKSLGGDYCFEIKERRSLRRGKFEIT
jgi:hypothetical protein